MLTTLALHRPAGPITSSSIAPPKPINQNYAAPDSSSPTRPGKPERKHARDPSAVLARPRSNGQTTAWPSRARKGDNKGLTRGPKPINHNYAGAAPPSRPDHLEQHRAAKTNKPKLRRARFFVTHAPREAGEKARPRPLSGFGATDLVGERPRSNGQTTAWPSRA